jgi:hypothetical protein
MYPKKVRTSFSYKKKRLECLRMMQLVKRMERACYKFKMKNKNRDMNDKSKSKTY